MAGATILRDVPIRSYCRFSGSRRAQTTGWMLLPPPLEPEPERGRPAIASALDPDRGRWPLGCSSLELMDCELRLESKRLV